MSQGTPPAAERSLAASLAAHESWAHTENPTARTAPARAAMWQKFVDQANGDERKAEHLWKAHFARLALKSAQARRRKAEELRSRIRTAEAELAAIEAEAAGGGPDATISVGFSPDVA